MPSDGEQDAKEWLAGVFDRAAPTYDTVAGAYHDHFGRRLVELAAVGPGDSVLDVACGRGAALVPAARNVGSGGRVAGIDLSAEMIERARAAAPDAELHVMDASTSTSTRDRSTRSSAPSGCSSFPIRSGRFRSSRASLRPMVLSPFRPGPRRTSGGSGRTNCSPASTSPGAPYTRPFDQADDLEALARHVCRHDVTVETEQHDVWLADEDEWWTWKWSYSLRGLLEQLDPDRVEQFRADAFARMQPLREPNGFRVELRAHLLIAR